MKIVGVEDEFRTSSETGGKARGLICLHENGFRTPAFYLLDYLIISSVKSNSEILIPVLEEWRLSNSIQKDQLWAVRSSTALEDGKQKSFAGQYLTCLNVPTSNLNEAVMAVLNSYYKQSNYADLSQSHGIVIQEMLAPDYSGVLFTKDPVNLLSDDTVINMIPGLGENLVSGEFDAFQIRHTAHSFVFEDLESDYQGEKLENGIPHNCIESGNKIKTETENHLNDLLEGARRLEQLIEAPVDVEFAILNGRVYWLQVRPITSRSLQEELIIWDSTNAEGNYPGLTLPLSISFTQITFEGAYLESARAIGFKTSILKQNQNNIQNMSGGIYGALYYNVGAWQSNLYQLPMGKRLVRQLPRIWNMSDVPFVAPPKRHTFIKRTGIFINLLFKLLNSRKHAINYATHITESQNRFSTEVLKNQTFDELVNSYWSLRTSSAKNWLAPILNGLFTMLIFFRLKRFIRKSKLNQTEPNFMNDILFTEGEVVSVNLVNSFQSLCGEIHTNEPLKELFEQTDCEEIWKEIKIKHAVFFEAIVTHISMYGERTSESELKMETISYIQNPLLFIAYLKLNMHPPVAGKPEKEKFNYHDVLKRYYPYNLVKRLIFNKLIYIMVKRVKARENYRYTRAQVFALFRQLFLQMGERLQVSGSIEDSRDVLYLYVNEIMDVSKQKNFKAIIEKRKVDYETHGQMERAARYVESNDKYYESIDDNVSIKGNQLKGIGCCSGAVEGSIVLIDKNTDLNTDFTACILVSKYFEPGWIGLFTQAKGLVSERGNLLSHTSILCREMGIPSIVGVKGLTAAVQGLKTLKMNGATGIIDLEQNELL
jgi:rifampicin phosphotransferase